MKIVMIGTGYVGLVSGVCFAEFGFNVTCIDKNEAIIARLKKGEIPIFEPGLKEILERNVSASRLTFSTDLAHHVKDADVVFIAVGTPSRRGDGEADLQYIEAASDEVAQCIKKGAVIVIKSTVVVGTNRIIYERMKKQRPDIDFSMVSNPEFLREGSAIEDFLHPDRVVVGVLDENGREAMRRIYRPLSLRETPVVFTSLENAELIKYAANAFLAMKVTFANQLADLCEKTGGNIQDVASAMGMDKRIGSKFLHAGPGFGGSCFPKDTRAFAATGKRYDAPQKLIETVIDINEQRKAKMAERIIDIARKNNVTKIAILGVAFKPNTDDIREAPALDIIPLLQKAGLMVKAHDPEAMDQAKDKLANVEWCHSPYEAAKDCGIAVILTEWNEYRALDLKQILQLMTGNVLIDMRNIYKSEDIQDIDIEYVSIGRPLIH
ncbi:UDP-glucose/GDP-mannose dehydrogenase family protein [Bartonella sp. HY329]|uniref:UDP-glucose dehydrogenase family protein n=1 Tax=unclassified Bartonella TaxID=2645622 RepID=UPI0021C63650|nr:MULTISPECIES: UDP-glucose/GDP-mannose dehydrogenase family protein [unclassified Bartonella]UXM94978.1 UDP-glucose/GDP-mannose dehydrogenase family protein [Bartonella sp. HY329]UXN09301.1 UDP-glucose/GDP-mannose dehydrogenase family protein [Bartonella sp. HY328]